MHEGTVRMKDALGRLCCRGYSVVIRCYTLSRGVVSRCTHLFHRSLRWVSGWQSRYVPLTGKQAIVRLLAGRAGVRRSLYVSLFIQ